MSWIMGEDLRHIICLVREHSIQEEVYCSWSPLLTGLDSVVSEHKNSMCSCLVKSYLVKLETSCTVILPPTLSFLWNPSPYRKCSLGSLTQGQFLTRKSNIRFVLVLLNFESVSRLRVFQFATRRQVLYKRMQCPLVAS